MKRGIAYLATICYTLKYPPPAIETMNIFARITVSVGLSLATLALVVAQAGAVTPYSDAPGYTADSSSSLY